MLDHAPNTAVKVTRAGESWHGGSHTWSLPVQQPDGAWTPGDWTPPVAPQLCNTGWHLTTEPAAWWSADEGVVAYLAEYDGAVQRRDDTDKIAVERCRLLRPLTAAELAAAGIYTNGEHDAAGQKNVWASGSATVTASGSATVTASGSATVTAWDSATVTAWDSATVRASGSATVRAYDSATVEAYGSAKAHAGGAATCIAWSGTTLVLTRSDTGVIVDRRVSPPKTYVKKKGLDGWRFSRGKWAQRAPRTAGVTP